MRWSQEYHSLKCTQFSCDKFAAVKTGALWNCRTCSENIFPFSHIDDNYEFYLSITETEFKSFPDNRQNKHSESKIFDPFKMITAWLNTKVNWNQTNPILVNLHIIWVEAVITIRKKLSTNWSIIKYQSSRFFCVICHYQKCPRRLVGACVLCEQNQPLFYSDWFLWNMTVSIHIWYILYKCIQAHLVDQVSGKGVGWEGGCLYMAENT